MSPHSGGAYAAIIISFAMNSLALNTARDLGGRMACSVIYGSGCWTTYGGYTALAARRLYSLLKPLHLS